MCHKAEHQLPLATLTFACTGSACTGLAGASLLVPMAPSASSAQGLAQGYARANPRQANPRGKYAAAQALIANATRGGWALPPQGALGGAPSFIAPGLLGGPAHVPAPGPPFRSAPWQPPQPLPPLASGNPFSDPRFLA